MRFVGNRALLGAAAMIIVGIVLSMLASDYVSGRGEAEGLTTSRWWWEIVLNSQILCAAFIWFTHIEKVKASTGWRALFSALQLLSGLVAVLVPVWIALAGILLDWFKTGPSMQELNATFYVCLAVWGLSWLAMWTVECIGRRRFVLPSFLAMGRWYYILIGISPMVLAVLLTIVETMRGGNQHYVYAPFLFYLQGAVPYLMASQRPPRNSAEEL
ncbi:hypothetical protein [Kordiimonas lacus]|uniref:Uncharacterized protein n=1 Tax=Kordiimonas lacus TaxID=637679 RepID=A0A1G7F1K3_9PROT|nr:hypothetical protein [Kordiimonas lacus]SDE69722.1 hypothetical protein SAMN04488071_3576 [Kordiimonas lacus]